MALGNCDQHMKVFRSNYLKGGSILNIHLPNGIKHEEVPIGCLQYHKGSLRAMSHFSLTQEISPLRLSWWTIPDSQSVSQMFQKTAPSLINACFYFVFWSPNALQKMCRLDNFIRGFLFNVSTYFGSTWCIRWSRLLDGNILQKMFSQPVIINNQTYTWNELTIRYI